LVHPCAKQVDSLSASNFGVQAIFPAHLADYNKLFGSYLPSRDSWYHRIGPSFLEVGQITVVGILDVILPNHRFIPGTGQDGSDQWLADFTAIACTHLV